MGASIEMMRSLARRRGFPGATPLLLGSIYAAINLENRLHDAGIPWGSRCEDDMSEEALALVGQFRRWVVFVREEDFEAATQIAHEDGLRTMKHLPTIFAAGLCDAHGYETLPCSHCYTGFDWMVRSDEEEARSVPPRHPSPL